MAMTPHTIELGADAFDRVAREAQRRGVSPNEVVDEIIRADLPNDMGMDLDSTLRRAAGLRSMLQPIDGVEVSRQARDDLQSRSG